MLNSMLFINLILSYFYEHSLCGIWWYGNSWTHLGARERQTVIVITLVAILLSEIYMSMSYFLSYFCSTHRLAGWILKSSPLFQIDVDYDNDYCDAKKTLTFLGSAKKMTLFSFCNFISFSFKNPLYNFLQAVLAA